MSGLPAHMFEPGYLELSTSACSGKNELLSDNSRVQFPSVAPLILTAALVLVTPIFVTAKVAESGAADNNNERNGLIIIDIYRNETSDALGDAFCAINWSRKTTTSLTDTRKNSTAYRARRYRRS